MKAAPTRPTLDAITLLDDDMNVFLQDLINIILINAGVRPACSLDGLNIYTGDVLRKHIKLRQSFIDAYYPNVTITPTPDSGYIGSREKHPIVPKGAVALGKFLGYPVTCANQWNKLTDDVNPAPLTYAFMFIVKYKNMSIQPFAYRCLTDDVLPQAEEMIKKMRAVLKSDQVIGKYLKSIELEVEKRYSVREVGRMLYAGEKLDKEAIWEINHALSSSKLKLGEFKLNDPFHRGMLAGLVVGNPMFYVNRFVENEHLNKEWKTLFDNNMKYIAKL